MEQVKTFVLMGALAILFMAAGYLLGGEEGMGLALLLAIGINFFSYFFSDKMVLKHYKAEEAGETNAPLMFQIVKRLSATAGLPMPKIYVIDEQVPNAFATGRNPSHAAVAATRGLLQLLSPEEIEAVLAHEMSHVRHYDILISSVAAVFAGAVSILGQMAQRRGSTRQNNAAAVSIAGGILASLAAGVVQMALSRSREYRADEGAALLTRKPEHLISALSKIEQYASTYQMKSASPQTAHFFIINPFGGQMSFNSLFSTHPATAERIKRLQMIKQNLDKNF